jgi:Ssp1 endopeptidase immunity protein Rap1a
MKGICRVVSVVAGVWAASPCVAEDGSTLYHWCENLPDAAMGYIVGVADALSTRRALPFCMPERVTRGQLQDVVCGYLREDPERRRYDATSAVWNAQRKAWPCNK